MPDVKKRNKNNIPSVEGKLDTEEKHSSLQAFLGSKNLLRTLSLTAVSLLFIQALFYYTKDEYTVFTFAKQSEVIPGKSLEVECSSDYLTEIKRYSGCSPKQCKRFVTDEIVSVQEAHKLVKIFKKGLRFGGADGGASILDLHSGALSKGRNFIDIYQSKAAKNLLSESDFDIYKKIKNKIKNAVANEFRADPDSLYLTSPTFFSEISSKVAVTIHDEYWHPHIDKQTYKSFHYTSLLYLGDYNIDFKGGRFIFIDKGSNTTIEPRTGRVSMFTSGAENLHYVEKVTDGVRYALTVAFTCDQKYAVKDPSIENFHD